MRTEKQITNILLLALLVLNALVRFYDISGFSLSNDELSAISRLNYSSLSELIREGVIATDPHPIGVQVFLYYWTALFGNGQFMIRFPFVMASLLAIYFLFKSMSIWFSNQRALLIAVFFSLTEFSLIQGQLARPYAIAMLFVMIFLWSWTKILFTDKLKRIYLISFIVSAVLAAYSHYFAALLIGIIGISGIGFAIKKGLFKLYSLLGACILFLCTAHLPISIAQFSRPSLTSWINKAELSFLSEHIFLLLNDSYILLILASVLILLSIYFFNKNSIRVKKFMALCLTFFLLPMLIAYVYSLYREPVMMNRVFYFSSAFFYAMLFAFIQDLRSNTFILRFTVLTTGVLTSTFLQTNFLKRDYVENFKDLVQKDFMEVHAIAGKKHNNVTFIGNFNSMKYLKYYMPREEFDWPITSVSTNKELAKSMEVIRQSRNEYLAYFWACKYQSVSILEYIALHFPTINKEAHYYNSGMWMFSRKVNERKEILNIEMLDTLIHSDVEFFDLYKDDYYLLSGNEVLNVHTKFDAKKCDNTLLVFSLVDEKGKVLKWEGINLSDFHFNEFDQDLFYSFIVPEEYEQGQHLSIYFWNPGKNSIVLSNVQVKGYEESISLVDPYANTRRP